jgi:hypothetical protein
VKRVAASAGFCAFAAACPSQAQSDAELARLLANPIPALTTLQVQYNHDRRRGAGDGSKDYVNFLPNIPIALDGDWNLISHTYTALVRQKEGSQTISGIGYVVPAFFFSPTRATSGGWLWGAGPVFQLPVADRRLASHKLGVGPTLFVARHDGPWSYGVLADHLSSVAGDDDQPDFSSTFFGPWLSYTTPAAWTYGVNAESIYDWKANRWSWPLHFLVSKVTRVGDQRLEVGGGLRYWADDDRQYDFGVRLYVTLVFGR